MPEHLNTPAPFDSSLCPAATMEDLSSEKVGEFLATARAVRGFPLPTN